MDSLLSALSNVNIEQQDISSRKGRKGARNGTILDTLREDERFTMLVDALEKNRGLRDDLENQDKNVSLFAPTNEAFKKLQEYLGSKDRSQKVTLPKMDEVFSTYYRFFVITLSLKKLTQRNGLMASY